MHGERHVILCTRIVIEANRLIAKRQQSVVRGLGLCESLGSGGQVARVDQALMRLEPGHMRIAEHRDAARLQPVGQHDGALDVRDRLPGQAIHQVEIDPRDPVLRQHGDGLGDQMEGLNAPDRDLDLPVELLHAEAHPVDADIAKCSRKGRRETARVELDSVLLEFGQIERVAQRLSDAVKPFGSQDGWRAAAPMNVNDLATAGPSTEDRDFVDQLPRIGFDGVAPQSRFGMTAAVEAKLRAIGNMQIERERGVVMQRREPGRVCSGVDRRGEMGCRGIGGVSRHRLSQKVGQIRRPHLAPVGSRFLPTAAPRSFTAVHRSSEINRIEPGFSTFR